MQNLFEEEGSQWKWICFKGLNPDLFIAKKYVFTVIEEVNKRRRFKK